LRNFLVKSCSRVTVGESGAFEGDGLLSTPNRNVSALSIIPSEVEEAVVIGPPSDGIHSALCDAFRGPLKLKKELKAVVPAS